MKQIQRTSTWTTPPTTGYMNAESHFSTRHPFGRMVTRGATPSFGFARSAGAPAYAVSPRRGNQPHAYLPPHADPVCVYQSPQGRLQEQQQIRNQNLYGMEYEPYLPQQACSRSGSSLDLKSVDEASDKMTITSPLMASDESVRLTPSTSMNDISEVESIDAPAELPVPAAPIFSCGSKYMPLSRPLSMVTGNKGLPTLALFQNCSLESKIVSDCADSHQELSLMLALPGLSTSQAPLLSLQQAGDILQTLNNPLVGLKVGRLTRKLAPNPALLTPTGDDVGTLALWISPTSDVRLFWHSFLKGPTSDGARAVEEQIAQIRCQGEGSPYKELFSHVELSEELAWVAAESDQEDGGCGIRLEMVKHDSSGRSFKLTMKKRHDRQKKELASKLATEEGEAGQLASEEKKKLRQLLADCMTEDPEEEETYFFWIAESSVSDGVQSLDKMQNRLDHLPTLAEESGVPDKKLQELYQWFSKAKEAAPQDGSLPPEVASWIDLGSGSSVPSQLFSNTCPESVPNWTESQPLVEDVEEEEDSGDKIREGCALSATANFLVTDKKWGLTHLATASVTVSVGVENTGLFSDEEKAHLDLSQCAHELAKKRAEAGASAEAERLGRIRLEEMVAVKTLKEMRSNKAAPAPSISESKTEIKKECCQSDELIQLQQRAMRKSAHEGNGQRRTPSPVPMYAGWHSPRAIPGQMFQANSVLHHSQVRAHPGDVTHMPEYFRQHVHYDVPMDHYLPTCQPWDEHGYSGGCVQVMAPYQQYEPQTWSVPHTYSPHPWPYGEPASPPVYQPGFVQATAPSTMSSHFQCPAPPQTPFLHGDRLQNDLRMQQPNMSLMRIAQEAREQNARKKRDFIPGPSGCNLAAANIDIHPENISYGWHDSANQLGTLYSNKSLNISRMSDGESDSETRVHAETQRNVTATSKDKMMYNGLFMRRV